MPKRQLTSLWFPLCSRSTKYWGHNKIEAVGWVRKQTTQPQGLQTKQHATYRRLHPSFNFHIFSVCCLRWLLTGDYATSRVARVSVYSTEREPAINSHWRRLSNISPTHDRTRLSFLLLIRFFWFIIQFLNLIPCSPLIPVPCCVTAVSKFIPACWIPFYVDQQCPHLRLRHLHLQSLAPVVKTHIQCWRTTKRRIA